LNKTGDEHVPFKKVEPELFEELEDLAKKSYERFQKEELSK
jgi:hypothetical protein